MKPSCDLNSSLIMLTHWVAGRKNTHLLWKWKKQEVEPAPLNMFNRLIQSNSSVHSSAQFCRLFCPSTQESAVAKTPVFIKTTSNIQFTLAWLLLCFYPSHGGTWFQKDLKESPKYRTDLKAALLLGKKEVTCLVCLCLNQVWLINEGTLSGGCWGV